MPTVQMLLFIQCGSITRCTSARELGETSTKEFLMGDTELRRQEVAEKREFIIWYTERGSKTKYDGKEMVVKWCH